MACAGADRRFVDERRSVVPGRGVYGAVRLHRWPSWSRTHSLPIDSTRYTAHNMNSHGEVDPARRSHSAEVEVSNVVEQRSHLDWDRSEWASASQGETLATGSTQARWNKFQWVGDRGQGQTREWRTARDMPEGASGFSGYRHNPAMQHWGRGSA